MIKQCIVNEIHRNARKNFQRCSVILKGIDDLWQADLIDLRSIKKYNNGYVYILTIIDCFSKYAWAMPLKSKAKLDVNKAFNQVLHDSGRCPINLQTDNGTEFYNDIFKKTCRNLNINHYSTFSTKKASIVERFIRTLKNKLYKLFSFNGNYKWVGKPLQDLMLEYNHTVHRTIKYKPANVTHSVESLIKDNIDKSNNNGKSCTNKHKYKIGDFVRISKYKNCFEKGYTPNWSTEIFQITKVNNSNPVTYNVKDQNNHSILGIFYEQELQKTSYPQVYLIEKIIKRRGNRLFVKWLGLGSDQNSWINKETIVK